MTVDLTALTPVAYGDAGPCVGCGATADATDQWGNAWCTPCWARRRAGDDPRDG